MTSRRRATTIDTDRLQLLQDQRTKAELLEEIPDRVGTEPIPTRLSRETIVAAIDRLAYSDVAHLTARSMNERQLRTWLADLCGTDFDAAAGRGLDYRLEELKRIDRALEEADGGDRR